MSLRCSRRSAVDRIWSSPCPDRPQTWRAVQDTCVRSLRVCEAGPWESQSNREAVRDCSWWNTVHAQSRVLKGWQNKIETISLYCWTLHADNINNVTVCSKLVVNLGQAMQKQFVHGCWLAYFKELQKCSFLKIGTTQFVLHLYRSKEVYIKLPWECPVFRNCRQTLGIKLRRDVDPSLQSCLRSRCNHRQIPSMDKTQRCLGWYDAELCDMMWIDWIQVVQVKSTKETRLSYRTGMDHDVEVGWCNFCVWRLDFYCHFCPLKQFFSQWLDIKAMFFAADKNRVH